MQREAAKSKKGFIGIARKVFIFLLVVMANEMDRSLSIHEICTMTTFFYIANTLPMKVCRRPNRKGGKK